MAIAITDIKFYKPAVTDEGPGHGGSSTTEEIIQGINALWDDVSAEEAKVGDIEYQKIFFGLDATAKAQILSNPTVHIFLQTPARDRIDIKCLTAVADSSNVMSDVSDDTSWNDPMAKTDAVLFDNITTDAAAGVWLRRVVPPATEGIEGNYIVLQIEGETM